MHDVLVLDRKSIADGKEVDHWRKTTCKQYLSNSVSRL